MSIDVKQLKALTKSLRVLYVEDDREIQKKMLTYLKKFFDSVESAMNGIEGLELYEKDKFDIVVTDISMPHMDGIEMIKAIKAIDENQPILVTTAHSESSYLFELIKTHIDGFILKPFEYDVINFELFKIAEKINMYKENEEYKLRLKSMVESLTQELENNYERSIYSIVELIEHRDTYTAGHSKRVAEYSELIAKQMGYSDEDVTLLHQAAILHDVGKIETPDAVLLNPNQLNEVEYKLIQEHVSVGFKLLDSIPMFKKLAPIVKSHHEHYDGGGYPEGLASESINKFARIMTVADSFDAMTTNRIYKGKKSLKEALDELKLLSGKQFDPDVVKAALVVLDGIDIDVNINQLPKTRLEKERFAYFYNDRLTAAYNQNYLDVILMKNQEEHLFRFITLVSLHHFTQFNKKEGWERGDDVLKEVANILLTHFGETRLFRVFGDDFVLVSQEALVLDGIEKVLDNFIKPYSFSYKIKQVELDNRKLAHLRDIEKLF